MKKSILITTQGLNNAHIAPHKPVGFVSLNFDSSRLTIDAYSDAFRDATPREKCLISLADEKTVYEFTTEDLFEVLRFYCEYSADKSRITSFRNRHHYIVTEKVTQG